MASSSPGADASRTAGINLGRIIQTKLCPTDDIIYCARDSSIFVIAEMTAGILVACVPTLGPLIFRGRHVQSARPHDLPTIGSARIRPRRHLAKFDSLLSTLDRSHVEEERNETWNEMGDIGAPTAHAVAGPGHQGGDRGILVTRDLDVHSLNPPTPKESEAF
jgi:hypothetical protein